MGRAVIMLRNGRAYRRDQFAAGLEAAGLRIETKITDPRPGDVLMIWNRNRSVEQLAQHYERRGAAVIVAENGYLQPGPEKHFALSLNKHNGAGRTPIGAAPRFAIPMRPWREDGSHVLILPQRGIGSAGVAMPYRWLSDVQAVIRRQTKRPIRVRNHPGNRPPSKPLEDDLAGAWCAVTWGSGAGIKTLFHGVPVFYGMSQWIGWRASLMIKPGVIESPVMPCRAELENAISWAQWTGTEIANGTAIREVLACAR